MKRPFLALLEAERPRHRLEALQRLEPDEALRLLWDAALTGSPAMTLRHWQAMRTVLSNIDGQG